MYKSIEIFDELMNQNYSLYYFYKQDITSLVEEYFYLKKKSQMSLINLKNMG